MSFSFLVRKAKHIFTYLETFSRKNFKKNTIIYKGGGTKAPDTFMPLYTKSVF